MLLTDGRATAPGPAAALATERLWREVHERLTAFVAQRVREPADVADIVQTVFLRVHRHLGSVEDGSRLLPWLFQITRNAIVDHYRSPTRRREVSLPADDAARPDAGGPDARSSDGEFGHFAAAEAEDTALAELSSCVRPMVERLPDQYRDALTLVELEGRSQVDAAALRGLSISGMKSRVQRGRAMLRESLLACCEVSSGATGGVLDFAPRRSSACGCGAGGCRDVSHAR